MSRGSAIEWTDDTWNPVTGCTKVSPGCAHCYAESFAERWRGVKGHHFEKGFDLVLRPERLDQPLGWKKPRRIFVNSMSDLFHKDVPSDFIQAVFTTMAKAHWHTFQVLTKRPRAMRDLLLRWEREGLTLREGYGVRLPNVWLGTSVEDQQRADERIPYLLQTPAAVRFLSCEPLLGRVVLNRYLFLTGASTAGPWVDWEGKRRGGGGAGGQMFSAKPSGDLDWVIVGGESGPGARTMHPSWVRDLRDECSEAGVSFFFKQWGAWCPPPEGQRYDTAKGRAGRPAAFITTRDGCVHCFQNGDPSGEVMVRLGKKKAGRLLDGRTWDEFPRGAA